MTTTNYLTDLVTKYFSTVFFLWVIGNILLRVLVKKKKNKKRKGKKGGGIGNVFYDIWCFLLKIFTLGGYECFTYCVRTCVIWDLVQYFDVCL